MRLADERGRPRISSVADEVSRAGKTSIRLQADDARIEGTQFVPSPPHPIPQSQVDKARGLAPARYPEVRWCPPQSQKSQPKARLST